MTTLAEINDTLLDQNLSLKEMVVEQESTNDAIQSLVAKISEQMDQAEDQRLKDTAKKPVITAKPQRALVERAKDAYANTPDGLFSGLLKGLGFGGGFGIAGFISGLLSKVLGLIGKSAGRLIRTGALIGAVKLFGEDVINALFGDSLTDAQKTDMRDALYATATWVGLGGKLITGLLAGAIAFLFPETSESTGGLITSGFKTALEKLGFKTEWLDKAMAGNEEIINSTIGAMAMAFVGRAIFMFGSKKLLIPLMGRLLTMAGVSAAVTAALNKLNPFKGATPPKIPDVDYLDPTNAPRPGPTGPNLPRTTPAGKPLTQAAETAGDIAKGTVSGRLDTKGMSKAQLKSAYGKSYKSVVKEGNRLATQATDLAKAGTDDALQGATKAAGNKWTKGMNGGLMKNGAPATITELIDDIQISKAAKFAKYAKFFKFVAKAAPFLGVAADMIDPVLAIYTDQPPNVIKKEVAGALGSLTGATGGFILGSALTAPTGPGAILGGLLGAVAGSVAGEYSAEAIAGYLLGMDPNPIPKVDRLGIRSSMGIIDTRFSPGGQADETFIPYGTGATKSGAMNIELLGSDPFGAGNSFTNPGKYPKVENRSAATNAPPVPAKTVKGRNAPRVEAPVPMNPETTAANPEKDSRSLIARWLGWGEKEIATVEKTTNPTATITELTAGVQSTKIATASTDIQSSSIVINPMKLSQTTQELMRSEGERTMQQETARVQPIIVDNGSSNVTNNNVQNTSAMMIPQQPAVDLLDGGLALGARRNGPF